MRMLKTIRIAAAAALPAAGVLLSCTLGATAPDPDAPSLDDVPRKKVLVLGIDGLRPDALFAAQTPNLDALIENGCFTPEACTGAIAAGGPGWSSFLTGVWMDKHGVRDNDFTGARFDAYPHFFVRLKERNPAAFTVHISDWKPIDERILGAAGADVRFFHDHSDDGDAKSVAAAVGALRHHDPDAMFVYFADLDSAGRTFGFHPQSRGYLDELEEIDGQIGYILEALAARPAYSGEDWLIIAGSNHGGTDDGSQGGDVTLHRQIPLIVSGPAAARGRVFSSANIVDIPATALAHLGVPIDPAWGLDGRPVGLKSRTAFNTNLLYNGGAERSTGYDDAAADAGIAGWTDTGAMTVIAYGAPDGFPSRRDIGPADRGKNFFCGGAASETAIHQLVDIADMARFVDLGLVRYKLSGYFGGFRDQRDLAWMTARFLDERGGELLSVTIGPVTMNDRTAGPAAESCFLTGLIRRQDHGRVPQGARRIRVSLHAEAASGSNDGYADNLHLSLWMPQEYDF